MYYSKIKGILHHPYTCLLQRQTFSMQWTVHEVFHKIWKVNYFRKYLKKEPSAKINRLWWSADKSDLFISIDIVHKICYSTVLISYLNFQVSQGSDIHLDVSEQSFEWATVISLCISWLTWCCSLNDIELEPSNKGNKFGPTKQLIFTWFGES